MPREFNARTMFEEVIAVIEFAWISGVFKWSAKEYEKAVHDMFGKTIDAKTVIERARFAHRKNEERSKTFKAMGAITNGRKYRDAVNSQCEAAVD